jgi:hypothetical protein
MRPSLQLIFVIVKVIALILNNDVQIHVQVIALISIQYPHTRPFIEENQMNRFYFPETTRVISLSNIRHACTF